MDYMPKMDSSPTKTGWLRPVMVLPALALVLCGTVAWLRLRPKAAPPAPPVVAVAVPAPAPPPVVAAAPDKAGPRHVAVVIDGPLETSLVREVGKEVGRPLAQVVVRTLVWWVNVPGDLRKGDTLDLLFEERDGEEPLVQAVRFVSQKRAQTYRAYRFKPEGAKYARYYQPSGEELELRLKDGPIDDYEQITSLLRDGRGHKGVDFKTAVGTQVTAPFDGVVGRKSWNWRANGNSLEIKESGGQHRAALLLHLSEVPEKLKTGDTVARGQAVAKSGNTGHSFAPHLHYQLMLGEKVLDPFASHETYRHSLPAAEQTSLAAAVRRLDDLMGVAVAHN